MANPRQTTTATKPAAITYESQDDAAARWGVSVDTIRRLIAAGKLPAYRLNRRIIRVRPADVDACFRPIPTTGR